ncbi:hypothetical protein [Arthrobacter sp. PAMC25564]|nr:hypothetical protein [Arthrobacter sp. PAMC25564]
MPKFTKGTLTIETAVATEAAELRRDGFTEVPADAFKAEAPKSSK